MAANSTNVEPWGCKEMGKHNNVSYKEKSSKLKNLRFVLLALTVSSELNTTPILSRN